MRRTVVAWSRCTLLCAFMAGPAWAGSADPLLLQNLDAVRAIHTDKDAKAVEAQNQRLDAAWAYFNAHAVEALPVLRQAVVDELASPSPRPFVLLDLGNFLYRQPAAPDKALAKRALLAIDAKAEIIQWNWPELFDFAHAVATEQDPALLPFLDAEFLRHDGAVEIPQHALTLHEFQVGAFLYGPYGRAGAEHLATLLGDAGLQKRVLEILSLVGGPEEDAAVARIVAPASDYPTLARVVTVLMGVGGPEGKAAVLRIDANSLAAQPRQWLEKMRPEVVKMSFEAVRQGAAGADKGQKVDGDALKARLEAMHDAYGKDDTLSPLAVLDSTLPREFLVGQLEGIRSRIFHRVSDEALSDLEVTNTLLNALRYRAK